MAAGVEIAYKGALPAPAQAWPQPPYVIMGRMCGRGERSLWPARPHLWRWNSFCREAGVSQTRLTSEHVGLLQAGSS